MAGPLLTYAQRERLSQVMDFPEDGSAPPQPDWYVALELASDLQVDIFRLEGLPVQEPFTSIAKTWAIIRRQAHSIADELIASARNLESRALANAQRGRVN